MVQEDQTPKCSNSSSGGGGGGNIVRSSKKQKPKRVPQRGLGVAQLERIRLEEQQKKDASSSSSSSPTMQLLSSNHQPCSSSIAFQPPAADHLSSSLFRPSSSSVIQNIELLNSNSSNVPLLSNPVGWGYAAGNVHKFYDSCDFNSGKESSGVDQGSNVRSNLDNLPYESIPVWPLPSLMHRPQQFQHHSSSVVRPLPDFCSFLTYFS